MDDRTTLTDTVEVIGVAQPCEDTVILHGSYYWFLYDEDGVVVDDGHVNNLVVAMGKAFLANRCVSNNKAALTHLAVGTSKVIAVLTQTALLAETARVPLSSTMSLGNVVSCTGVIPAGTGTGTIEEVGLFNANSGGDMISRAVTGTITKPAGLALQFTWTLTVN